jgi:hypothetical protein
MGRMPQALFGLKGGSLGEAPESVKQKTYSLLFRSSSPKSLTSHFSPGSQAHAEAGANSDFSE